MPFQSPTRLTKTIPQLDCLRDCHELASGSGFDIAIGQHHRPCRLCSSIACRALHRDQRSPGHAAIRIRSGVHDHGDRVRHRATGVHLKHLHSRSLHIYEGSFTEYQLKCQSRRSSASHYNDAQSSSSINLRASCRRLLAPGVGVSPAIRGPVAILYGEI
jgi:hypothetical protein